MLSPLELGKPYPTASTTSTRPGGWIASLFCAIQTNIELGTCKLQETNLICAGIKCWQILTYVSSLGSQLQSFLIGDRCVVILLDANQTLHASESLRTWKASIVSCSSGSSRSARYRIQLESEEGKYEKDEQKGPRRENTGKLILVKGNLGW